MILQQVTPHHGFVHEHAEQILIAWWLASAAIGSLPAPTVTSSAFYVWAFKFLNTVAANISRAYSTTVEKSPNFQDAMKNNQPGPNDGR